MYNIISHVLYYHSRMILSLMYNIISHVLYYSCIILSLMYNIITHVLYNICILFYCFSLLSSAAIGALKTIHQSQEDKFKLRHTDTLRSIEYFNEIQSMSKEHL